VAEQRATTPTMTLARMPICAFVPIRMLASQPTMPPTISARRCPSLLLQPAIVGADA
jgi:hypothetical protein